MISLIILQKYLKIQIWALEGFKLYHVYHKCLTSKKCSPFLHRPEEYHSFLSSSHEEYQHPSVGDLSSRDDNGPPPPADYGPPPPAKYVPPPPEKYVPAPPEEYGPPPPGDYKPLVVKNYIPHNVFTHFVNLAPGM